MDNVTYYARFSYCDDGICVDFPDVIDAYTCGDNKEDAVEMAKDVLSLVLDVGENEVSNIYPPSTFDELEKEANGVLRYYENSFEFVPITIIPENDSYTKNLKSRRFLKTAIKNLDEIHNEFLKTEFGVYNINRLNETQIESLYDKLQEIEKSEYDSGSEKGLLAAALSDYFLDKINEKIYG